MLTIESEAITPECGTGMVSARMLRRWCAPESILAITDLLDEPILLPHLISQAKLGSATIILAHVISSDTPQVQHRPDLIQRPASPIQQARAVLERIAQHLRWFGFICEPMVLSGRPEVEIPELARALFVDRVILRMEDNPESRLRQVPSLAERILPGMEVPTCVIGRCVSLSTRVSTRNITLAVSSSSDCETSLGFASRLAQELHANLTVVHVLDRNSSGQGIAIRTPKELAARLPSSAWREAELFCSAKLAVREGSPAEEILRHCSSTHQDLVILSSPGQHWRDSVAYRILSGAQCPVLLVGHQAAQETISLSPADRRMPAHGENTFEIQRRIAGVYTFDRGVRSVF